MCPRANAASEIHNILYVFYISDNGDWIFTYGTQIVQTTPIVMEKSQCDQFKTTFKYMRRKAMWMYVCIFFEYPLIESKISIHILV